MGVEVPSEPINRKEQYLAKIAGQAVEIPAEPLTREEAYLDKIAKNGSGGGGGTTNYNSLSNKPQIGGVELQGNKSLADLGIASAQSVSNITNGESINDFAGVETALDGVETALASKQPTLTFDDTPIDGSNNPVKSNGIYDSLAGKQNITDNTLTTTDKTVPGAINEIKSGLTTLDNEVNGDATTYPYADVITINDAVPANLADCSVKVEPVQDLHGYDKPWVGGAGKNKAEISNATLAGTIRTADIPSGTVTMSGTTSESGYGPTVLWGQKLQEGTYILSAESFTGTGYSILKNWDYYANLDINGTTIEADGTSTYRIAKYVASGENVDVTITGLMIRLATETDSTFAPYTNICPISGHTEAVVTRCGKNLYSGGEAGMINQGTGEDEPSGTVTRSYFINVGGGNSIALSHFDATSSGVRVFYYGKNKVYMTSQVFNFDANNSIIVSRPNGCEWIRFQAINGVFSSTTSVQVELGSTATPYEPYAGQQYTIALGDTIYGCTVDFDSGVMTVDRAIATVNDFSFSSGKSEGGLAKVEYKPSNLSANRDKCLSNMMVIVTPSASWASTVPCFTVSENSGIRVYYDGDTLQDFQDDYANIQIVYELANPTTIQLTPQQIQLLQGQNTLYASTGDISVTVNGVSGSIGALQEQVNELAEEVAEIKPVDYSTTEQKTGQKWIDGKDIYFNTFELTEPIEISNSAWTSLGISATGIDTLINAVLHFPPTGIRNTEVRVDGGVVKAIASRTGTFEVSCVILYYTKATT